MQLQNDNIITLDLADPLWIGVFLACASGFVLLIVLADVHELYRKQRFAELVTIAQPASPSEELLLRLTFGRVGYEETLRILARKR